MTIAITAANAAEVALSRQSEAARPCMNPASVIWPVCNPDPVVRHGVQKTAKSRRWAESPVIILNRV